jgi:short-subunit dehydrogenase
VAGLLTATRAVLPEFRAAGKGTVLVTGGGLSLQPLPEYGSLAVGKAGIRNLAQSLHLALKPENIRVATVTICGFVSVHSPVHNPPAIAAAFWKLYQDESSGFEIQL